MYMWVGTVYMYMYSVYIHVLYKCVQTLADMYMYLGKYFYMYMNFLLSYFYMYMSMYIRWFRWSF